ncbi:LLM class F420-dependent oxidoreductase, partial [Mycobacterium sp. ITM-2017-0098]
IRKTIMVNDLSPAPETRDDFVRAMAGYAELGVDEVIVFPPTGSPAKWIDSIAPTVKQLAELG